MTYIKHIVEHITDELCGAKDYAEKYVEYKVKGESQWANRFKEMAQDELKHAQYFHELAVAEIDNISKVFTPPESMLEQWDKDHKYYVEKAAWIKQMLNM